MNASPPVARREIFGWAMFDFANSSYTTVVVTVAFSVYFTSTVAPAGRGDALWGLGVFLANALTVLLSPLVGAAADETGRKKALLAATTALCAGGTVALAAVDPGMVVWGLTLFVLSNIGFSLGENLIAAFLPEIARPADIGRISGLGWGLGYLGGLASLLAVKPLLAKGFGVENLDGLRATWIATGLFFLVAALPTFLFLRERAPRRPVALGPTTRAAFARLATTARSLRRFRELGRFLAVFFVYSCGLMTVIAFAGVYAVKTLGFGPGELMGLFLALQLTSSLGAIAFGVIQDRVGAPRTIRLVLVLWLGALAAVAGAPNKAFFWGVALVAGLGIGSLQAASRALVGLLSPESKRAEFFAFWGLAGKAAYAVGPAVFGLVSTASGSQRVALLVDGVFFIAGLLAMRSIDEERGRAEAAAWEAAH